MQRLPLPFVLAAALAAQGPTGGAAAPQADPTFVHQFGASSATGSFRCKFDDRGAGVVYAQMKDHFVDVAAASKTTHSALVNGALAAGAQTMDIDSTTLTRIVPGDEFSFTGLPLTFTVINTSPLTASGNRVAGVTFAPPIPAGGVADNMGVTFKPWHVDDYLLLVASGADYSFRVEQQDRSKEVFPQNLLTAPWHREVLGDGAVRFTIESPGGLRLLKTFRHRPGQRGLALELALENTHDKDHENGVFYLGLGGPTLVNKSEASLFGNPAVAIGAGVGGEAVSVGPKAGMHQELLKIDGQELLMAGSTNRFFGGFLFPLDDAAKRAVLNVDVVTLPLVDDQDSGTKANTMLRAILGMKLPIPAVGGPSSMATFGVYLGPKSYTVFAESPEHERFLPILDVDLNPPCCGITVPGGRFMARMLVKLLGIFHGLIGTWGIAIMMLTILVRGCLAPVNFHMQKSMRAFGKRMAVLKPKLDKLKQHYEGDPKGYQKAMLAFQREHKMMPPLGGCLPPFLVMPIYIGLFTALRTAYDLRQQSFLFMQDLSQPDALLLLPFWPHNFNLLPLLWITMFIVLQIRTPLPTDPQQRQMQQMMRYMPILFGLMLYNYASGLMVYMVTSMLWTFVESAITKRILGPMDPNATGVPQAPIM